MSMRRYLFVALLTTSLIHAGACLVFDGKVATELDASTTDASGDASADGRDATRGGDARDGTLDDRHDDASSDQGPQDQLARDADAAPDKEAGDAKGVDGVECNGSVCTGGLKCCAKGGGGTTKWMFLHPSCEPRCSDGGGGGYYDYRCNDSEDCDGGKVCCAFRNMGTAPPFTTSVCQAKCAPPAKELCQKGSSAGCRLAGTCMTGDQHYLPPGFDECN